MVGPVHDHQGAHGGDEAERRAQHELRPARAAERQPTHQQELGKPYRAAGARAPARDEPRQRVHGGSVSRPGECGKRAGQRPVVKVSTSSVCDETPEPRAPTYAPVPPVMASR